MNLENLLQQKDPWAGLDCERQGCMLCTTKAQTAKNLRQKCTKRNLVYETWCETCRQRDIEKAMGRNEGEEEDSDGTNGDRIPREVPEVKLHKYIGESARSSHESGREHISDLENLRSCSHMLKHFVEAHEDDELGDMNFMMKVVKFHKTAFERQISESVLIQSNRNHNLLNSRAEFNRCALPRITLKMGDKNVNDKDIEKVLKEEKDMEERIEMKIRELRKHKNKNRTSKRGFPARKRLKLSDGNGIASISGLAASISRHGCLQF